MTKGAVRPWHWVVVVGLTAGLAGCGGSAVKPAAAHTPAATTASLSVPDAAVLLPDGSGAQNPVMAFGSIWVAAHERNHVLRVDPATHRVVAQIDTHGQPGGMIAAGNDLWVVDYGASHLLVAIDARTNRVTHRFDLPGELCCQPAVHGGKVWVGGMSAGGEPALLSVDATSGKRGKQLPGSDGPVVVGTELWASRNGSLVRVDPKTAQATQLDSPAGVVLSASPPAAGLTWAMAGGMAVGLDPNGAVSRTVTAPEGAKLSYTEGSVVTSAEVVWATDGTRTVWRIDPTKPTAALAYRFPAPDTLTLTGDGAGGVWIAQFFGRLVHLPAPA